MKRSTRILLKITLLFAVVGAAFGIAGFCLGFERDQLSEALGKVRGRNTFFSGKTKKFSETYTDIDALKLEIGAVSCRILSSDDGTWKVAGEEVPSDFETKAGGGTLKISGNTHRFWGFGFGGNSGAGIEIYVPKNAKLKDMDLDIGAGEVVMENGSLISCEKLALDVGAGSCTLNLDLSKDADVECGVGEIVLNLQGIESDFDYAVECGIGSVQIGDTEYSGLGTDKKISNKSKKKIGAQCGIGSISIDFEGK